jgi:hypothetical protein
MKVLMLRKGRRRIIAVKRREPKPDQMVRKLREADRLLAVSEDVT